VAFGPFCVEFTIGFFFVQQPWRVFCVSPFGLLLICITWSRLFPSRALLLFGSTFSNSLFNPGFLCCLMLDFSVVAWRLSYTLLRGLEVGCPLGAFLFFCPAPLCVFFFSRRLSLRFHVLASSFFASLLAPFAYALGLPAWRMFFPNFFSPLWPALYWASAEHGSLFSLEFLVAWKWWRGNGSSLCSLSPPPLVFGILEELKDDPPSPRLILPAPPLNANPQIPNGGR